LATLKEVFMAAKVSSTSNSVSIVSVIYTPKGFFFNGSLTVDLARRCIKRILAKYPPREAWLVCMYYFPDGKTNLNWHLNKFKEQGSYDTGFKLTRDDVLLLYANWRRCYALQHTCTSVFAIHTYAPDIRVIYPDKHLPFDIRLGYAIQMDYTVMRSIGSGSGIFRPISKIS